MPSKQNLSPPKKLSYTFTANRFLTLWNAEAITVPCHVDEVGTLGKLLHLVMPGGAAANDGWVVTLFWYSLTTVKC